jgi:hypothetical protein
MSIWFATTPTDNVLLLNEKGEFYYTNKLRSENLEDAGEVSVYFNKNGNRKIEVNSLYVEMCEKDVICILEKEYELLFYEQSQRIKEISFFFEGNEIHLSLTPNDSTTEDIELYQEFYGLISAKSKNGRRAFLVELFFEKIDGEFIPKRFILSYPRDARDHYHIRFNTIELFQNYQSEL